MGVKVVCFKILETAYPRKKNLPSRTENENIIGECVLRGVPPPFESEKSYVFCHCSYILCPFSSFADYLFRSYLLFPSARTTLSVFISHVDLLRSNIDIGLEKRNRSDIGLTKSRHPWLPVKDARDSPPLLERTVTEASPLTSRGSAASLVSAGVSQRGAFPTRSVHNIHIWSMTTV